jgi:hypothetical protein
MTLAIVILLKLLKNVGLRNKKAPKEGLIV